MISVVVLQNSKGLLKGELRSSSKTCVPSTFDGNEVTCIEAETVSDVAVTGDQEPTTITVIKTEPKVSCVPLVSVICIFHIGYIQNYLFMCHSVLVKQKFDSREWISNSF